MKGIKFIIGFAIFGFLLSLISGTLAVGNTFGRILIHAFIFALIFALLAFGINFIAAKFFNFDSDYSSEISVGQTPSQDSTSTHSVDIVVQDEELPAEDNSSQFVVSPNRQMLEPDDVSDVVKSSGTSTSPSSQTNSETVSENSAHNAVIQANAASSSSSNSNNFNGTNNGFIPVSLGETPSNLTGTEAKSHNDIKKEEVSSVSPESDEGAEEGELDTLPDLEDMSGYTSVPASMVSSNEEAVEESSFSESSSSSGISAEEVTDGKDAELMAKAISTLLAKE